MRRRRLLWLSLVLLCSFVVDLTPPELIYLNDQDPENDLDYLEKTDKLKFYFDFKDEESGWVSYRYQVWQMLHGNRIRLTPHPTASSDWKSGAQAAENETLKDEAVVFKDGNKIAAGSQVLFRVGAQNGAGLEAPIDSDGVTIDSTPPEVHVY